MEQSPSSNRWCHEKEKFAHRHTQGKDPVETGVPQPSPRTFQKLGEWPGADPTPLLSKGAWPCPHLGPGHPASRLRDNKCQLLFRPRGL